MTATLTTNPAVPANQHPAKACTVALDAAALRRLLADVRLFSSDADMFPGLCGLMLHTDICGDEDVLVATATDRYSIAQAHQPATITGTVAGAVFLANAAVDALLDGLGRVLAEADHDDALREAIAEWSDEVCGIDEDGCPPLPRTVPASATLTVTGQAVELATLQATIRVACGGDTSLQQQALRYLDKPVEAGSHAALAGRLLRRAGEVAIVRDNVPVVLDVADGKNPTRMVIGERFRAAAMPVRLPTPPTVPVLRTVA